MELPKILIVDDDGDLSEMLDTYFSMENYEVRTAAWGRDAVRISQEEDIHLVMLDVRLPDIDGYEVCRQIRQNRRTHDLPIIFLSEKSDRVDKLQGLELGVVDYITKPFDIQELRLRVYNAIQRVRQPSPVNAITDLPETQILDRRLETLVQESRPWTVYLMSVLGLGRLRERSGFLAADEMLRAVALLARNAVREFGNEGDMVAHFNPETLAVVTTPERLITIRTRIEMRVRPSLMHYYGNEPGNSDDTRLGLKLRTGVLDHNSGTFFTLDDLKEALRVTIAPPPDAEE